MKQKRGFPVVFAKQLLILILIFGSISCQRSSTGVEIRESTLPASTQKLTITVSPLGSSFKLDNYRLNIPKDWFYTVVNDNQMNGWAFMNHDPSKTSVNGFKDWAGGLWIVAPVPTELNVEDFSINLNAQVEEYGQSDFDAILLPVQQAGLLDLSDSEIIFGQASVSTWAGKECIQMNGIVRFGDTGDELSASVYLMWVDQNFISYYNFSDTAITSDFESVFIASRESLVIP